MTKVQNFKKNFWKRRVATAIVTTFGSNVVTECNVELYSFDKKFLSIKTIPYHQLNKEMKSLGLKPKLS